MRDQVLFAVLRCHCTECDPPAQLRMQHPSPHAYMHQASAQQNQEPKLKAKLLLKARWPGWFPLAAKLATNAATYDCRSLSSLLSHKPGWINLQC